MHSTVAIIVAEVGRAPAPFKPTVVILLQRSGGADDIVYALLTFFKLAAVEPPSSGDSSVVKGSLAPLACPRTTSGATLLTKRGRDGDAKEAEESTISRGAASQAASARFPGGSRARTSSSANWYTTFQGLRATTGLLRTTNAGLSFS